MYQASDLKKNLRIKMDNEPYIVTEFNFVKPGKGQALYRCKLKNMITGASLNGPSVPWTPSSLPICRKRKCSTSIRKRGNTASWTTSASSRSF